MIAHVSGAPTDRRTSVCAVARGEDRSVGAWLSHYRAVDVLTGARSPVLRRLPDLRPCDVMTFDGAHLRAARGRAAAGRSPRGRGSSGRRSNVEDAGSVEMPDLACQALRMRPDRLVGECGGAEVVDLA